jgi:tripartite-type tricarboxylate transporter receptor subunit TctC
MMLATRILVSSAVAIALAAAAQAQTYPDRLIRMVVPLGPGGPADTMARIVTQPLSPLLGQTIIVENRAGAGGLLGSKAVAAAEPDGYTLLFGNISTLVVLPAVTRYKDYDPAKVFSPIAKVSQNFEVLIVRPDFPAKSVQELVAYAKANPGKLNFGSAGIGNTTHMAAELFMLKTGTKMVHVPYRGAAEAITAVIAGQVELFFGDIGGVLPLMREGRIRALAISSEKRSPDVPELPTMIESGVPDYVVLTFTGVVAPAGTPPAIVSKLNGAINTALKQPEIAAAYAKLGAETHPASTGDFTAFLADERKKWDGVVKDANLKID